MKKKSKKRATLQVKVNVFPAIIIHVMEDDGSEESVTPIPMTHLDEMVFQILPLLWTIYWHGSLGFLGGLVRSVGMWLAQAGAFFRWKQWRPRPLLVTATHPAIKSKKAGWMVRHIQEFLESIIVIWYILVFGWILGCSFKWALKG